MVGLGDDGTEYVDVTRGTVEGGNIVAFWAGLVGTDEEGAEALGVGEDGTEAVVGLVATGGGDAKVAGAGAGGGEAAGGGAVAAGGGGVGS